MHDFTPLSSLAGGALIGVAASLFLLTHGRVAGISGIYAGVFGRGTPDRRTRLSFLAGLLLAALAVRLVHPEAFASSWTASLPLALAAGVLVGIGTQLGGGCTSGHGVCGISRLSRRSMVATVAFMATAGVTVFVIRHLIGGGQ
jgi:uncharacterized protein